VDENITKIHGRHELQFGGRFRYELLETVPDQQEQAGSHAFATLATAQLDPSTGASYGSVPFTGHNAANLFLGYASYSALFNRALYRLQSMERSLYFQDNFKASSRLTLNFGVRYEYNTPIKERDNTFQGFDPKTHAIVLSRPVSDLVAMKDAVQSIADAYAGLGVKYETPSQAGLPDSLVSPNRLDFGPRVGFAYRFGNSAHTTVLRGGYSIYAYPERLRSYNGEMQFNVPTNGRFRLDYNQAQYSPDGNPNYWLRTQPSIVAGVNSATALDINKATGIVPGSGNIFYFDPHQPTARAHEWNVTLEKEILDNTVVRAAWVGTHGARIDQFYSYNDAPNQYIWYLTQGTLYPTGPLANVLRRGFDKQVLGTIWQYQKTGWSNDSSIQLEVQHRYSRGFAYQLFYVMSNAERSAGNAWVDDVLQAPNMFLPGAVPDANNHALAKLLTYHRDTDIPKHRVRWNWVVDVPVGKGKPLARNAHGLANAIIGGWQVAGNGTAVTRYFSLPSGLWGPTNGVQVYGTKYPVQNCMSGTCYPGYLYWNNYIPANRINSYNAAGKPNGIMGVPADYKPFQTPLWPTPANGGSSADPLFNFYETNTVWVALKDGSVQRTSLDTNLNPLRQQYVLAPFLWSLDASAFKSVPLKERFTLRVNVDFFNVLNMPGMATPGSYGIISNQFSAQAPRSLQLTMRLNW
jgi:hypothetical protein